MSEDPSFLGKYEIKTVLGRGAMGVVYQAHDPDINRIVAIKVLHPHLMESKEGKAFRERFRREAQAAARCMHPNIVAVYELGNEKGQDFIVMEYVQGEELKFFLGSGHNFTENEALHIMVEILKALSLAHKYDVIHRDIKPANIILLDNGGVKLADFGVAHIKESDLTVAGNMVGTPSYMSPEGLRGKSVDLRADLYSTGMVLLEILSGKKPSTEELYTKEIESFLDEVFLDKTNINKDLQDIIRIVLSKDPDNRFDDADVFLKAIEDYQNNNSKLESIGGAAQSLSETVISARPLIEDQDIPIDPTWSDQLLNELEQGLASYVGPMASIIIKRSSGVSHSVDELINNLAENIPDQNEKIEFLRKARKSKEREETAEKSNEQSAISSMSISQFFTEDDLAVITKAFAFYIGPLAKNLIEKELKNFSSQDILLENLASHIDDSNDRNIFLEKVRKI